MKIRLLIIWHSELSTVLVAWPLHSFRLFGLCLMSFVLCVYEV